MSEPIPLPEPTPVSAPYWRALREHRIEIQYSPSTGRYVFYPRTLAPGTLATTSNGARSTVRERCSPTPSPHGPTGPPWAGALPQLLAVVEWDVGPKVSTELVGVAPEDIRIGMRVAPVFYDVPDTEVTLLRYRPA